MKYTTEIVVDLPRDEFIKKLDAPENMKHWQRGPINYEQLSQNPGQEGARMSLGYKMGKREMEMVETIIKHNLPAEMHTIYDTKGVHNIQKKLFQGRKWKNPVGLGIRISIFRPWDETDGIFDARCL